MKIAIAGTGQLSQMLALAGIPLGFSFSFIREDSAEDSRCVQGLGDVITLTEHGNDRELFLALGQPEVLTTEKEQIDISLLHQLAPFCEVLPQPSAFATCQHRAL